MGDRRSAGSFAATGPIRAALKSQYHAALAMLRHAVKLCPEKLWDGAGHTNECWQIAYHTLFFAHAYSQPDREAFRPWEHHREDNQYPDAIPGPPDPESDLPLLPRPYTREQVLAYWDFVAGAMDDFVDALDVLSPETGFPNYPTLTKLEHQILNVRHIQHGAAQIADRVRAAAGVGVDWVGAGRGKRAVAEAG
jgi:hypothetical protein